MCATLACTYPGATELVQLIEIVYVFALSRMHVFVHYRFFTLLPQLSVSTLASLRTAMHAAGINMRYLAAVRAQLKSTSLRRLLLASMLLRGVKSFLRERLRRARSDREYIEQAVFLLNRLFAHTTSTSHRSSRNFPPIEWEQLIMLMTGKYGKYGGINSSELEHIRKHPEQYWLLLLDMSAQVLGLRFSTEFLARMSHPTATLAQLTLTVETVVALEAEAREVFIPLFKLTRTCTHILCTHGCAPSRMHVTPNGNTSRSYRPSIEKEAS